MELFVTWALAFAVLVLIILLGKSYQTNKELVKENDCRKENYKLIKEENLLLKNIVKILNNRCLDIITPLDKKSLPFLVTDIKGIVTAEDGDIQNLDYTSIRFKQTQDGVLIYLNGAMIPFDGDISLSPKVLQNVDKMEALRRLYYVFDKKDVSIQYSIQTLRTILDQLNK